MLGILKKNQKKKTKKEKKTFAALKKYSKLEKLRFSAPFIKLMAVMYKNYKLLLRSKSSIMVFFFGPLLIMFLIGVGFNTSNLVGLNLATYSESYSTLSDSLINNLSDGQFTIIKMDGKQQCIDAVKFDNYQACLIFPKDMVMDNVGEVIEIYVDNSRINLANLITEKLASKVSLKADQLSEGVVSQLLGTLVFIDEETETGKDNINNLHKSNQENRQKLGALTSEFKTIDLSYSSFDSTDPLNKLETLRDEWNLTTSDVSSLKNSIQTLGSRYRSVTSLIDDVETKINTMESESKNIETNIANDKKNLDVIVGNFNNIQDSIDTIKITNPDTIVRPIKTTIKPLSLKRTYLYYSMPLLLVLLVMFVCIFMSAITVVRERKASAYFRNFITPTFDGIFILGQFLSLISIIVVQLIIILSFAAAFLHGLNNLVYLYIGLILVLLASLFIYIGIGLGHLLNSSESVTLGAVSVSAIFLIFSNAILPSEALTGLLRKIVFYNPLMIGENILKRLILFDSSLFMVKKLLLILIIWLLIVALITSIASALTKRRKYN